MTDPEPYQDPDAPLYAVLAAADAAEPRLVLVGDGCLCNSRYETPEQPPTGPDQYRVWNGHDYEWRELDEDVIAEQKHKAQVRDELDEAKRRTRRDVAAVIT